MTFSTFRKYQTPLLIAAVVFTVAVFVFFPSFGALDDAMSGGGSDSVYGRFRLQGGGDPVDVTLWEFKRAREDLGRFQGNFTELKDEEVWQQLMLVADARAAGLRVTDLDLVSFLREAGLVDADYDLLWRNRQFASAKAFEAFMKTYLLAQQWTDVLVREASVLSADEIYLSWRVDHELFDMEALAFSDLDPESIADPGDEVLAAYFDETPEYLRNRRYVEPARYGIAYAWLPLASTVADLPAERLEALDEVTDETVQTRWEQLKSTRFPDMEEADEATLATLRNELVVMGLVSAANAAWVAAGDLAVEGPMPGDDGTANPAVVALKKQAFLELMASFGLQTSDPEGMLDPDGLTDLADIGSALLSAQLTSVEAGDTRYFQPFGQDTEAHVVFVEETVAAVPLGFADARDQVLEQWRQEADQVGARAADFRKALADAARELPEAQELIAPLVDSAASAADTRITLAELENDGELLDDAAKQAIQDEELAAVQVAIDGRLAEFAARFWDEVSVAALAPDDGTVQQLLLADVPRNYRQNMDEDEDADGLDRFLKINGQVFQQDVDGVTGVLRHAGGNQSVVVKVTARRFPPLADMLNDKDGMDESRQRLSYTNLSTFGLSFTPERFAAPYSAENPFGHELMLAEPVAMAIEDEDAEG